MDERQDFTIQPDRTRPQPALSLPRTGFRRILVVLFLMATLGACASLTTEQMPLLLINGLYDKLVPRGSAELLLEAARPPVRQIWLPHDHLMPGDLDAMRELADSTLSHFEFFRQGTDFDGRVR